MATARSFLAPALERLDEALWDLPGVDASDPDGIRREALSLLPDDLAQKLHGLLDTLKMLEHAEAPDARALGEAVFALGQLHAEIVALSRAQAEIESAWIGTDRVDPRALDGQQPEQIRKFLALRDRLFRQVADFTLKLLLALFGLLVVLLVLGLI
jgi:hypothetical protein